MEGFCEHLKILGEKSRAGWLLWVKWFGSELGSAGGRHGGTRSEIRGSREYIAYDKAGRPADIVRWREHHTIDYDVL